MDIYYPRIRLGTYCQKLHKSVTEILLMNSVRNLDISRQVELALLLDNAVLPCQLIYCFQGEIADHLVEVIVRKGLLSRRNRKNHMGRGSASQIVLDRFLRQGVLWRSKPLMYVLGMWHLSALISQIMNKCSRFIMRIIWRVLSAQPQALTVLTYRASYTVYL